MVFRMGFVYSVRYVVIMVRSHPFLIFCFNMPTHTHTQILFQKTVFLIKDKDFRLIELVTSSQLDNCNDQGTYNTN